MDHHASAPTSNSMVVAEKNAHRPGGCVGIFFKLFEWNRRFAKNNLFPKKLLSPDENLPKSKHLLARGLNGKPGNLHSELRQPMRSPSLVARLMGLESIPVADSHGLFCENQYPKKTRQGTRHEIQPLISRKSRAVSRFGADALQIRNVLSRSRKRNLKLTSPVKSPRAAKSTSTLMGAATRILEPGLQATSRAKCALTYPNSMAKPMNGVVREATTVIRLPIQLSCNVVNAQVLKTQTTCRNCGHSIEVMDLKSDAIEPQPPRTVPQVPGCFYRSSLDLPTSHTHSERGGSVVLLRPDAIHAQGHVISGAHHQPAISKGMLSSSNGQNHWDMVSNSVVHDQSCYSSSAHSHPPMVTREDRIPPKCNNTNTRSRKVPTKTACIDKRDFAVLNRGMSQPCVGSARKPRSYDESFSGKTIYPAFAKSRPADLGMDQCSFVKGTRDVLGTMLEQKLKELTSQAEYELATVAGGRTTASILRELVSALATQRPISPDLNHTLSLDSAFSYKLSQAEAGAKSLSMRLCGDRLSPGSILDARLSNESCYSSGKDDGLVPLDTTRSPNDRETSNNIPPVTHLFRHIPRILDRICISDVKASTIYSGYVKEVLLNAELLFGKADVHSEGSVDFLLGPFLDELETLAVVAWRSTVVYGIQVSNGKTDNPSRRFLLDCLVECLSVRHDSYINCGFKAWCELPRPSGMETLIHVFDSEVRKWASMARRSPYEIIDLELSTSLGTWTHFELDELETGGEIGQIIFQGLLEEIIAEFLS